MSSLFGADDAAPPVATVNGNRNPLVSLAVALITAVLYVLDQFKNLVAWCTITFPGYVRCHTGAKGVDRMLMYPGV